MSVWWHDAGFQDVVEGMLMSLPGQAKNPGDQDVELRHESSDVGRTGDVEERGAVTKGAVHALPPLKTARSPTQLSAAEMGLAGIRL